MNASSAAQIVAISRNFINRILAASLRCMGRWHGPRPIHGTARCFSDACPSPRVPLRIALRAVRRRPLHPSLTFDSVFRTGRCI
jgi:3-methyladenine DNA glycosylase AlkC